MAISSTTCNKADNGFISCNTIVPLETLPAVPYAMNFANMGNTTAAVPPVRFPWSLGESATGAFGLVWNSSSQHVTSALIETKVPRGHLAIVGAFTVMKNDVGLLGFAIPKSPSQLHQCMFTYCMKTYEGINVQNGETRVGPVKSVPLTISSFLWEAKKGIWGDLWFNMSVPGNDKEANYSMPLLDYLNIGQYVEDIMDSSVSYEGGGSFLPGRGGKMAPTFGLATYNVDNLTAMMETIADSMTNSMRTAQANLTTVPGTALVIETYIHIEWKWLVLPIVVAVLSLVLLIVVIIRTHSRGFEGQSTICASTNLRTNANDMAIAWKSSSLPLLFYELEGWSQSAKNFENEEELIQMSKSMRGRLLLDKDHRVFERERLLRARPLNRMLGQDEQF